jgi:hypothetical protein
MAGKGTPVVFRPDHPAVKEKAGLQKPAASLASPK